MGHACRCMSVCVCVCVRARALLAFIERLLGSVLKVGFYIMCVCAFGCCFVGANGLLVDACQCYCFLIFVCLPLSKHFPCKTW